ncbi:MAG: sugar ABC transporter permease [Anaerolineaceae bacterium]|nr:sugar ABC transporter permease [Anaerolineaceae bacterium]
MKRVFLAPSVVIILMFSIFPLIWTLGISFTDNQRGGSPAVAAIQSENPDYNGFLGMGFEVTLRNYQRVFEDSRLHTTAKNTLFYVVVGITIQYVIGFLLALVLNQEFRFRRFVRVLFLLPMMTTPVAAAYTGRMIFDQSLGPLADLFKTMSRFLGLATPISVPWMTDPSVAPWTLVIVDSWQWIPFVTLIILAALQGMPEELYEAARVDGANPWQIFWGITFPILLPISVTVIMIRGLEIFKIIDVIVIMTGGGPGSATESLTMYIKDTALQFGNYGYAAAISYVLLVLVIAFTTAILGLSRRVVPQNR